MNNITVYKKRKPKSIAWIIKRIIQFVFVTFLMGVILVRAAIIGRGDKTGFAESLFVYLKENKIVPADFLETEKLDFIVFKFMAVASFILAFIIVVLSLIASYTDA